MHVLDTKTTRQFDSKTTWQPGIHNGGCRPLITCLTGRNMSRPTSTRNYKPYHNYPNYGVKFSKSFFPYFTKMFCSLAPKLSVLEQSEFKKELKVSLKPNKIKHYSYGPKLGNKLLTRLRVGRSFLGSIPSDLKKSDRKLKSYKKKSYKIFIFASPSNIKSKKWQKIFDFFFRWHGQKFSITFSKPNIFTKCLVSEYEVGPT